MNTERINLFQQKWFKYTLFFIGVALFALFLANLKIFQYNQRLTWDKYWDKQITMFIKVSLWILMGLTVYWLALRFRFEKKKWLGSIVVHLVCSFSYAALHSYVYWGMVLLAKQFSFDFDDNKFSDVFILSYRFNFVIYWMILNLSLAFDYYRRYRKREKEAAELAIKSSRLEVQLAQAQLQVLKMQLQPHFLFNTLHTINGLMFEDVKAANKMLTLLSDLLRISLDNAKVNEIPLKEEIDFTNIYLNIQQIRFKGRLQVERNIDIDTLNASVPNLLIQPLIENAVTHGIAPHAKEGRITIITRKKAKKLQIEIHDSGKGIKGKDKDNTTVGLGISNTIERLNQLYGAKYKFDLKDSPLGGVLVYIELPFRHSPEKAKKEINETTVR